jgi:hypothetical protein
MESDQVEEPLDLVDPDQIEDPKVKVLKFPPPAAAQVVTRETERTPAHKRAAAGSDSRRERLKRYEALGYGEGNLDHPTSDRVKRKPHDSLSLGEDNYTVPAYLRRSAD